MSNRKVAARKVGLTDRSLRALKRAPKGKRETVWDALMPGLAVRVTDRGKRSFYAVRRRAGQAQPTWVLLGAYPVVTLAEARARAREALGALGEGKDPAALAEAERRAEAEAERQRVDNTFAALAEKFIKQYLPKLRSARAAEALIRRELIPALGDRPIGEIRRRDVIKLLEDIAARGAEHPGRARPKSGGEHAARHALAALRKMFNWCLSRDVEGLEGNPCARIKEADLFGGAIKARDRVLSDDEIRWVWQAAEAAKASARAEAEARAKEQGRQVAAVATDPFAVLYQALLLTGQRRNEVARSRWSEIGGEVDAATLTVPAERMKGKKAHVVPLTPAVLALLGELPRYAGDGYVFSTTGGRRPVSGFSRAQARMRRAVEKLAAPAAVPHWEVHDLRRSARTGLSTVGITPFVAELVVAHTQSGVHGTYDLHRYDAEKRAALEKWEARLLAIVAPEPEPAAPDNVLALRERVRA